MKYFETFDYYDGCMLAFCIFEAIVIFKLSSIIRKQNGGKSDRRSKS